MDILWQSSFKSLQVDLHTIRSKWPAWKVGKSCSTACSNCMQMNVKTCKHTSLVFLRKVILRRLHKCLNTNNTELMNICVCFGEYRTKQNMCICIYIPAQMHTHCMYELVQVCMLTHMCEYMCAHGTCMCACVHVCVNFRAIDCGQEHFKKVNTDHYSAISSRSYFPHKRKLWGEKREGQKKETDFKMCSKEKQTQGFSLPSLLFWLLSLQL